MIWLFFLFIWTDWSSYPVISIHSDKKIDYVTINDTLYKPIISKKKIKIAVLGNIKFDELLKYKDVFDIAIFDNMGDVLWTNTDFISAKEIDPFANVSYFLEGANPKIIVSGRIKNVQYKNGMMMLNPDRFFSIIDSIKGVKTYYILYNHPLMEGDSFYIKAALASGRCYSDSFTVKDLPIVWETPANGTDVYCSKNIVVLPPYVYLINGKRVFDGIDGNVVKVANNTVFFDNYGLKFMGYKKWSIIDYRNRGKLVDVNSGSFLFEKDDRYCFYGKEDSFEFAKFNGKLKIYKDGVLMLSDGKLNYFGKLNTSLLRWRNVKDFVVYNDLIGIVMDSVVYVINSKGNLIYETPFNGDSVVIDVNEKYLALSNERGLHVFNIKTKEEVLWHPVRWKRNIKRIPLSLYYNKIAFVEGSKLYYRILP